MQQSTVKWFDAKKGYGFLDHPSGGDDVFVHYSQIISTKDFKTLRTGQEVKFDLSDGPKGLHALDVKPLDEKEDAGTKKANTQPGGDGASATGPDSAPTEASAPAEPETAQTTSSSSDEGGDDEDEDDEWAWDEEEWTDEYGNPPDPMAGPSF